MQRILKLSDTQKLHQDSWQLYEGEGLADLPDQGHWLFPLSLWLTRQNDLPAGAGLWLDTEDDHQPLSELDISQIPLIVVHFGQFADGRGLSCVVLLRKRLAYTGKIRATGDVLPDLLDYMVRCGFDSFVLRTDEELSAAQDNLAVMEHYYQGSVVKEKPLFNLVDRQVLAGSKDLAD